MQFGAVTGDGALAALERRERLAKLGNSLLRALRVDDDDIRRIAGRDAVIPQIHQPRRTVREHLEALCDAQAGAGTIFANVNWSFVAEVT